jgi:hypothetical protein
VLSVYVRRGRLPDPGEIVFCNSDTTLEDVELLIRRFIKAKQFGKGESLYCLANIHSLSYTKQCAVVDRLQAIIVRARPGRLSALSVPQRFPMKIYCVRGF